MKQVDTIKRMQREGMTKTEISDRLSVDRKTVRKYATREDFSPGNQGTEERPSKLDRWKRIIDGWLDDDRRMRYKQRHTAKRIHERLREEHGEQYNCSYPLVQRYCKRKHAERIKQSQGFQELVWHPGEAQMDFGEADVCEGGDLVAYKYMVVSFPNSNGSYTQLFGGETSECVTQGLADIFQRIGGVPRRLIVDNASGVGKRIGEKIQYSDHFLRFKCHYDFEVTFCNPYSGHEKGHVENKVGYIRRNFFVPVPVIEDIEEYNRRLLEKSEEDWNRNHYKKHRLISELFEEDRKALHPLPVKPFHPYRMEKIATDGYGKFCLEKQHWYSSKPELGNAHVIVWIGAHHIKVLDESGECITQHRRQYGRKRTDTTDWSTSASRIMKHYGSWRNSGLRASMSEPLRAVVDSLDRSGFNEAMKIIRDLSPKYGLETILIAMEETARSAALTRYNVQAITMRFTHNGIDGVPDDGPDLCSYDKILLGSGGRA